MHTEKKFTNIPPFSLSSNIFSLTVNIYYSFKYIYTFQVLPNKILQINFEIEGHVIFKKTSEFM